MNKRITYLILFISMILSLVACSTQPAATSSLVGTRAPDFTLANTDSGETSLADYKGTPVLLFFHMAVG